MSHPRFIALEVSCWEYNYFRDEKSSVCSETVIVEPLVRESAKDMAGAADSGLNLNVCLSSERGGCQDWKMENMVPVFLCQSSSPLLGSMISPVTGWWRTFVLPM